MALIEYAQEELTRAGVFDADSDYGEAMGPVVMEMIARFAEEGHSGASAGMAIYLFKRLASLKPITPLDNPMAKREFIDHGCTFQSTRYCSLFSEDGGKRWYDLDLKVPRWKRLFGVYRSYVSFPYMPK